MQQILQVFLAITLKAKVINKNHSFEVKEKKKGQLFLAITFFLIQYLLHLNNFLKNKKNKNSKDIFY